MLTHSQRSQLSEGAAVWGITLDDAALDRFSLFGSLLEEGNRRLNLTRIAPEDMVALHFLDSLALAAVLKPVPGARVLDVGTGAGFPGIPLALAFPGIRVTLLDGTLKRLAFLDNVISELHLSGVQTCHGRAEEIMHDPVHRNRFDLVTARAVAKLPVLAGWLIPLTRIGGHAVAYKSRDIAEEVEEARPIVAGLHAGIESVTEVPIPTTDIVRKLVVLRRQNPVPEPRPGHKPEPHGTSHRPHPSANPASPTRRKGAS